MRAWLQRGMAAARLGGDRSDLWPAGSLAAIAYLGWATLLLVMAPPNPDSWAFLAINFVTSGSFPFNVVALAVAVVAGFATLCLVAALGEAALQRGASGPPDRMGATAPPPLSHEVLTGLSVILVATLPAVAAAGALAVGIIDVAPAAFQSPDLATPVLVRVLLDVWPLLVLLVVATIVAQAFGGVALRLAIGPGRRPVGQAIGDAARRILRRPLPHLAVALAGLLKDALSVLVTYALLRVLWAPINAELGRGRLIAPDTLLLLVGFVAIWLALLLAAGALHVTISAWWAFELGEPGGGKRPLDAAAPPAA
jgi:hypothetical protein